MTPYYMATWKFDQTSEGWVAYVTWRWLTQLVEVVSIECNCHRLLRKVLTAEDWVNIAPFDEVRHVVCFRDLARLRQTVARVGQTATLDLLCVFREPTKPPVAPQSAFTFLGYDLIDEHLRTSQGNSKGAAAGLSARPARKLQPMGHLSCLQVAQRI
jgi:hypothetical protein